MKPYTEDEVNQALEAISNGQSLRKVSTIWGIPRSTLQRRLQGIQPNDIAYASFQKLSPTQERQLTEWVWI